jgi:hypothetical protein
VCHLDIHIRLEALVSERCAMLAMNQYRADQGYAQAYGETSFFENADAMRELCKELRDVHS